MEDETSALASLQICLSGSYKMIIYGSDLRTAGAFVFFGSTRLVFHANVRLWGTLSARNQNWPALQLWWQWERLISRTNRRVDSII